MNEQVQRKRARSPSYPGIDLKEALSRARALYRREGKNAAPIETILSHWGYKTGSGPGLVTIAALKKFGLLSDSGSKADRQAKLTDLALDILLDEREHSPEREAIIRAAALNPPIHDELWGKYNGQLPSDSSLRFMLIRERHFTESGATEFIAQFRRTLAFAKLTDSFSMSECPDDKGDQHPEEAMSSAAHAMAGSASKAQTPPNSSDQSLRDIQIPLPGQPWAILRGPFPMTEQTWNQMTAILQAMKPALVAKDSEGEEGWER